jgi:Flp pilus assembly protein TadB
MQKSRLSLVSLFVSLYIYFLSILVISPLVSLLFLLVSLLVGLPASLRRLVHKPIQKLFQLDIVNELSI